MNKMTFMAASFVKAVSCIAALSLLSPVLHAGATTNSYVGSKMNDALFGKHEIPNLLKEKVDFASLSEVIENWYYDDDGIGEEAERIMKEHGFGDMIKPALPRLQILQQKSTNLMMRPSSSLHDYLILAQFNICLLAEPGVSDRELISAIGLLRYANVGKEGSAILASFVEEAALRFANSRKSARAAMLMYNTKKFRSKKDDLRWKEAVSWLVVGFEDVNSQDRFACRFEYLVLTYFKLTDEAWTEKHEMEIRELSKMKIDGYASEVPSLAEKFSELKNREEWWDLTYQYIRGI